MVLCTDSDLLRQEAEGLGLPRADDRGLLQLRQRPPRLGGGELTALAAAGAGGCRRGPARTVIINVQGDQPFIDPAVIDAMAEAFARTTPAPAVLTPVYRMAAEKVHNPNVVKTLLAADGRALYFSRSALPHVRGVEPPMTGTSTLPSGGMWGSTATGPMCWPAGAACPPRPWSRPRSSSSCA